jgi:hypothetical protein
MRSRKITSFRRKIKGSEPTTFPEPTKAINLFISTPAKWFEWNARTPTFPLSTTRTLGIPQPDVIGVRPQYLRVEQMDCTIINLEFSVIDSMGDVMVGESNVYRNLDQYKKIIIEPMLEAQARAPNELLVLMYFETCGATSLAHEAIARETLKEAKSLLFHRRILPLRLLQIGRDLKSLRKDELDKRIERINNIIKSRDFINIIFQWPIVYSTSNMKILDLAQAEIREIVNHHIRNCEEAASYRGKESTFYRQFDDFLRYSWHYTPTKVMDLQEFERAMRTGDWHVLYPDEVNIEDSVLLVHGFTGEVLQAAKIFEEATKSDKIIASCSPRAHGIKAVLYTPRSENEINII